MTVSLDGLIDCSKYGLIYDWECAEFLGVSIFSFKEAIELYKEKLGNKFVYNDYYFSFEAADSLNIKKENKLEEI